MAIAGLVLLTTQEARHAVWTALLTATKITDVSPGGDPCKFAAVLEAPALDMEDELASLRAWEGVLTVDIALVNYEDEVEEGKAISSPPRKPRKYSTPQV